MAEWISVKDRLPEVPENSYENWPKMQPLYVVLHKSSDGRYGASLMTAGIIDFEVKRQKETDRFKITHWMPLPEQPKEGGQDESM